MSDKTSTSKDSALPIRATEEYKKLFRELSNSFESQKDFFEVLINNFIYNEHQKKRENILSFSNEVNLISTNLNNILTIFKSIAAKSQDTLGSVEDSYKQKLSNLNLTIETTKAEYEDKITSLNKKLSQTTEKATLLEQANKGLSLEKENFNDSLSKLESELEKFKSENLQLKSEIHELKNIEKQNLTLEKNNNDLNHELKIKNDEITNLSNIVISKDFQIGVLNKKIIALEDTIKDCNKTFKDNLNSLKNSTELYENNLKENLERELSIHYKEEIITLKEKLNEFQIKYIELLNPKEK